MYKIETDWLKKWSVYQPHKLALREHRRNIQWDYVDLNIRVTALSHYLSNQLKLKKGDRLAVYSKNNAEYVFLFFACMKSGIILVPLNFRLTAPELDVLLQDSQPDCVIYDKEYYDGLKKIPFVNNVGTISDIAEITPFLTGQITNLHDTTTVTISIEDLVMILYTAGTTGLPKGVMINHRMLFWNSINTGLRLKISSDDHTQSFAPFFHTGGWNVLLTPFIHHGASHTILNGFDADLILELMESEKTTLLFGVPTMLQMMADSPLFDKADLSSVRYAIVGGAPMPIPLINVWHDKGVLIRQGYGLTEVGPNCFSLPERDAVRKRGSIGFPNFYMESRIVNENCADCDTDEVGELWLRSPVVTDGYWNKPEETSKAITDGWFHTGDMVIRDSENYYYVVDRKKNMYISGGENVYPAEVEKILYSHKGVKEVAVIGIPDEKWGEVGKAFIVINQGIQISEEELFDLCRKSLAKYKTPKMIEFINELPKNDAGKIDRKKLKRTTL